MKMKRIAVCLITLLLATTFAACAKADSSSGEEQSREASMVSAEETTEINMPDMSGESFEWEGTSYLTIKGVLRSPATFDGQIADMIVTCDGKWTEAYDDALVFYTKDESYTSSSDFWMVIPKSIADSFTPMKGDVVKIFGTISAEYSAYKSGDYSQPAILVSAIEMFAENTAENAAAASTRMKAGADAPTIQDILRSPAAFAGKEVEMEFVCGSLWTRADDKSLVFWTEDGSYSQSTHFLMVVPKSIADYNAPIEDDVIYITGVIESDYSIYPDGSKAQPAIRVTALEILAQREGETAEAGITYTKEGVKYMTTQGILRSPAVYAGKEVNMILTCRRKWTQDPNKALVFWIKDDSYPVSHDFLMVIPKSIADNFTPMEDEVVSITGVIDTDYSAYGSGIDATPAIIVSKISLVQ